MTWWAQHGNAIGLATAGCLLAGLGALTRYFSKLNDKKLEAASAAPSPPPPPLVTSTTQLAADFEAATIALSRARLEIENLHVALRNVREDAETNLRRQRRTLDELELEDARKAETITSLRALLDAARAENEALHRQIKGSRHGTETRRPADDPDRDRRRGQPTRGGWPVAREEVGPPHRGRLQGKAPR